MLNPFLTGKPIYNTEGLSLHKHIGKNWMVDSTSKEKVIVELIFSTRYKMSNGMGFPTMWYVRPAKPQISLRICAV